MNNFLIDTHCHLQDVIYEGFNVADLVSDAKRENVKFIVVSGYDEESNIKAIELANRHEEIYATVGFHPECKERITVMQLSILKEQLSHKKTVGVGEIGLDYHYPDIDKDIQKDNFIVQLQLANEVKKSIVVHSRDSIGDTFEILAEYKKNDIGGVIHCYSGSVEMANKFTNLNMMLGIGGVLTYKNSKMLKDVVEKTDIENLILETDSPYLSPEPKRGQINFPGNIPIIASKVANIKGLSIAAVTCATTENARRLFDFSETL